MRGTFVLRGITVVVAAGILSSCAVAAPTRSSTVSWLPLAPVSTTTTTTTTTMLAVVQPCEAGQLRATAGQGQGAGGTDMSVVVLTNIGSTCRLSGFPELLGETAAHGVLPIPYRKGFGYFGVLIPANLTTGQKGELYIGYSEACQALNEPSQAADKANALANTYYGVQIVLPDGKGTVAAKGVTFDGACGLSEGRLGVATPVPGAITVVPGTPETLTATLSMPASAQSGSTLKYLVTLRNPTKKIVKWTHCPNYTETIQTTLYYMSRTQLITKTFELNCSSAVSVRPGHSVHFAMQLPVRKIARSSSAYFSWQLDSGVGPFARSNVMIFASR